MKNSSQNFSDGKTDQSAFDFKKNSNYKVYRMKNNSGKINTKLSNQYISIYVWIYENGVNELHPHLN